MSGSSPDGKTQYQWSPEMQPRWDRGLNYLDRSLFPGGIDNANGDMGTYKPYQGQRFAPEHYNQFAARDNAYTLMQGANSPLGSMNAASDQVQDTLGGRYMGQNPGAGGGMQDDPWTQKFRNKPAAMENRFQGVDNPFFKDTVRNTMEDATNAYKQGTSADTTRMFNLSGAFGGSAHQNAVANNEGALAKQLGNIGNQMYSGQYDRSAGLEEGRLGRWTGATEGLLSRGEAGWQRGQDRASNAFEGERGRQLAATGLGQNEQGLAIDRGNWANQLGRENQQDRQRQSDFDYQQWTEQQNHRFKILELLMSNYGRAQGGTGSTTSSVYGGSNAGAIGGGLLGLASLFAGGG